MTGAIWPLKEGFVYPELSAGPYGMPELQKRPSFAIALSGGGYRATSLALGWVRALHELGYMQQARYLSTNSGGSWFNGAYSYTQVPSQVFLGHYLPPSKLDLGALAAGNGPGSYGRAIQRASIVGKALGNAFANVLTADTDTKVGAWSVAVAEDFLAPFGVGNKESSVTALGTRAGVGQVLAKQHPDLPFMTACATPDKPFPIILGSVLAPESPTKYAPIEFTPLYGGVPAVMNGTDPLLGGGFVEPLLLNTYPPGPEGAASTPPRRGGGPLSATAKPNYPLPLASMVGISSSFAAQGLRPEGDAAAALSGSEQLQYWNPVDFTGGKRNFADGGGADNLAITPLLRRGVRRILCGVAIGAPPEGAVSWAQYQWDVSGLFGAVPPDPSKKNDQVNGVDVDVFNRFMQVFPAGGFKELYAALEAAYKAGRNTVHKAKYTVLDNPYKAVKGGWEVEVLWVMNNKVAAWEAQLPPFAQAMLARDRAWEKPADKNATAADKKRPEFKDYPYISTFNADYSPELVTLLSQQASWQIMDAKGLIDALLASPAAETAPAAAAASAADAAGGKQPAAAAGAQKVTPGG